MICIDVGRVGILLKFSVLAYSFTCVRMDFG